MINEIFKININNKVDQVFCNDLTYFSISGPWDASWHSGKVKGLLRFSRNNTKIEQEFYGDSISEVMQLMYNFLSEQNDYAIRKSELER